MFDIQSSGEGRVLMSGRLDAAQATAAQTFMDAINGPCTVDMMALDYISSAGLRVLLSTQKRLKGTGHALHLINVSRQIADVFKYSGFDKLFSIELKA